LGMGLGAGGNPLQDVSRELSPPHVSFTLHMCMCVYARVCAFMFGHMHIMSYFLWLLVILEVRSVLY
jgi:hypothetical protein